MNKDNEGAIWKNEKRTTDRHPHFTGNAVINGVEYWVSAWKRDEDAKPNAPALKFSLRPKEQRTDSERSQDAQRPAGGDDFSDDVPFSNYELRGYWV